MESYQNFSQRTSDHHVKRKLSTVRLTPQINSTIFVYSPTNYTYTQHYDRVALNNSYTLLSINSLLDKNSTNHL